ncbi:hypothetical protein CVT24_002896 [Panaeolus cyanescens]|uniref:RNase H type-1 domain-containing protein n=1 Tax=Panaeolus cyanescens TaxID=181874 RepID=A0A409YXR9_9AGAR|nr:hypothetical protein CVT24_002896 [Panaeolus cyanescens]
MLHKVDPREYDVVLIQEPHIDHLGNTRANAGWRVAYPTGHRDKPKATRAVTLISTSINTSNWTLETIACQDVVLTRMNTSSGMVNIYNIYNDCNHDVSMRAVVEDVRERRAGGGGTREGQGEEEWLWAGDFNRHHPMWDDDGNQHLFTRANLRAAQKLINNLTAFDMRMTLPKGIPTLEAMSTKNKTRVDNVFCSEELQQRVIKCRVREADRVGKSDHFPIVTELDMTTDKVQEQPTHNFRLTDWDAFRTKLQEKLENLPRPREFRRGELDEFLQARTALEEAIDSTVDEVVPKTRKVPWRKRWWTKELEGLQRRAKGAGRKVERAKKRGRGRERVEELEESFRRARNTYTQAIKEEKKRHWEEWLEELDDKEVWLAGRMVGGSGSDGGRTRVPSLRIEGGREAISNEDKGRVFFEAFFPKRTAPQAVEMRGRKRAKWKYAPTTNAEIDEGVPEGHVEWVRRRNEGRRTRLVFDDHTTDEFEVEDGLDQGDAQSLILYLIYNADLPSIQRKEEGSVTTVVAFVDDVGVIATAHDFRTAHKGIKKVMDGRGGIMEWARTHNCTFGMEKFQLIDFSRKKTVDEDGNKVDIPRPNLRLNSLTIKPGKQAKFLGLILDQELRWKEQCTRVITKASYWAAQLRRLAKNKGGIGYKNLRRLFIGTALPRILYGIEIFDPPRRGRARTFRSALEKKLDSVVGRVAVLIVGGMRSSPNDVAMVHANLDPAKIIVEREYAKAAIRMATLPKTHPLNSHVLRAAKRYVQRYPSPLHHLMNTFDIPVESMEKIAPHVRMGWDPGRVTVKVEEDREEAVRMEARRENRTQDLYTDGSLTEKGVAGAAVWMRRGRERDRRARRIGEADENTVYEAELMGLVLGMDIALANGFSGTIHIGLDNQAVLTTIRTRKARFAQHLWKKLESRVKNYLRRNRDNNVELRWVPGHEGVEGNERADEAARGAAETERGEGGSDGEGGEEAESWEEEEEIPMSRAAMRQKLMKRVTEKRRDEWRASSRYEKINGYDQTLPSRTFSKLTTKMKRKQASIIFQMRTGHIQLKKHLARIGKADSPICEKCHRKDETVYHYLMECRGHEIARRKHFGYMGRNNSTMTKLLSDPAHLPKLFRYLNDTGRFTQNFGTFDIPAEP